MKTQAGFDLLLTSFMVVNALSLVDAPFVQPQLPLVLMAQCYAPSSISSNGEACVVCTYPHPKVICGEND